MSKNKYQSLSVQDLIDDTVGGPIFVLNTSDRITRGGDVFITVPVGNSTRPVKVPRTWIPVELTKTLPRKALLESVYFMEAASRGLIQIISREDALKIQSKSGYTAEVERLRQKDDAVRAEGMARGIGKNVTVVSPNSGDEDEDKPSRSVTVVGKKGVATVSVEDGDDEDDNEAATVSASFVAWTNKLNMMEGGAAFNELKIKGPMEYEECLHLIENTKHDKIRRVLSKKVESMNDD